MRKIVPLFIALAVSFFGIHSYLKKNSKDIHIEEIGFITHNFSSTPLQGGRGKLTLKNKCLYLEYDNVLYLPLWPDHFQLAVVDEELVLLKNDVPFAKIGQSINFGGMYPREGKKYIKKMGLDYTSAEHCDFSHITLLGVTHLAEE